MQLPKINSKFNWVQNLKWEICNLFDLSLNLLNTFIKLTTSGLKTHAWLPSSAHCFAMGALNSRIKPSQPKRELSESNPLQFCSTTVLPYSLQSLSLLHTDGAHPMPYHSSRPHPAFSWMEMAYPPITNGHLTSAAGLWGISSCCNKGMLAGNF